MRQATGNHSVHHYMAAGSTNHDSHSPNLETAMYVAGALSAVLSQALEIVTIKHYLVPAKAVSWSGSFCRTDCRGPCLQ